MPMRQTMAMVLGYLLLSAFVVERWTSLARTEVHAHGWCSIVKLANGSAASPFVHRRLLPDAARLLVSALPSRTWTAVTHWLHGNGILKERIRSRISRLNWKEQDYPILFCATFLIACSVVGFMLAICWLVSLLYETPWWLAYLLGGLLGLALLGGNGDWHYQGYPYDFPNACVFAVALAALVARRWWFFAVFALACYSKETAILLMPAYILMPRQRQGPRFWGALGLMLSVFLVIRLCIVRTYANPLGAEFWFPTRNFRLLQSWVIFESWWIPILVVGLVRLLRFRHLYPLCLRRLSVLLVPLIGLGFFKGWIEERRQYLEMLPILGLIVVQWVMEEMGLGHYLQARRPAATEDPPVDVLARVGPTSPPAQRTAA